MISRVFLPRLFLNFLARCAVTSDFFSGRIYYAESKLAENKSDVIEALNNAIDMKDEGIMIKRPDSVYKPGGRNNAGWIKVKPEYQDNLTDTCDVIILGGYYR